MKGIVRTFGRWKDGKGAFVKLDNGSQFYVRNHASIIPKYGDEIEYDFTDESEFAGKKPIKINRVNTMAQQAGVQKPSDGMRHLTMDPEAQVTPINADKEKAILARFREYQIETMRYCRQDALVLLKMELDERQSKTAPMDLSLEGAGLAKAFFEKRCKPWYYFREEEMRR